MLYIHVRKFMIDSVFTYQRLNKDYFLLNLLKFGCRFSRAQKWLLISKMPCITLCQQGLIDISFNKIDGIIASYDELHGKLRLHFVWTHSA